MLLSTYNDVSIKVNVFSGKPQDFIPWSALFLAHAAYRGYKKLLLGKETAPTTSDGEMLDPDDATNAIIIKRISNNEKGFGELLYAMNHASAGRTAFHIVMNTITDKYPNGNITVAWKQLKKKFAPTAAPNRRSLTNQFFAACLKPSVDPDSYINYMEDLRARLKDMKYNMTNEQFLDQILGTLGNSYDQQVYRMEAELQDGTLTTEKVRDKLH